jgi:hypothetical protein
MADTANIAAAIQQGVHRRPIQALNTAPQAANSVKDKYKRDGV